mgnify:CR=1 FL=1
MSRSAIPQIILTFYEAMKAEKEKKADFVKERSRKGEKKRVRDTKKTFCDV